RVLALLRAPTVFDALGTITNEFRGFRKSLWRARREELFSEEPLWFLREYSAAYGDDFQRFSGDMCRAATNAASGDTGLHKVELTTALRAKGREYDTVIIPDVVEGIWPHTLSVDIEQDRRLFYVAVTRPKHNLIMFVSR